MQVPQPLKLERVDSEGLRLLGLDDVSSDCLQLMNFSSLQCMPAESFRSGVGAPHFLMEMQALGAMRKDVAWDVASSAKDKVRRFYTRPLEGGPVWQFSDVRLDDFCPAITPHFLSLSLSLSLLPLSAPTIYVFLYLYLSLSIYIYISLSLSLFLFLPLSRRGQPEILAPLLLMAADPTLARIWAQSYFSNPRTSNPPIIPDGTAPCRIEGERFCCVMLCKISPRICKFEHETIAR